MSSMARLSRKLLRLQQKFNQLRRKGETEKRSKHRHHGRFHQKSGISSSSSDFSGDEVETDSSMSSHYSDGGPMDQDDSPACESPLPHDTPLPLELLNALGDVPSPPSEFGQPVHPEIVARWEEPLKKGLVDGARQDLLKDLKCPENLKLLAPPLVNSSVKAALPPSALDRDARLAGNQRQLGLAISAIGSVVSGMLVQGASAEEVASLSTAGRVLCDLHHNISSTRKFLLSKHMRKDAQQPLLSAPLDGLLFGDDLDSRLKAHKELEKASNELKLIKPSTSNVKGDLNSRGPVRRHQGARAGRPSQNYAPKHRRYQNKRYNYNKPNKAYRPKLNGAKSNHSQQYQPQPQQRRQARKI